MRISFGGGPRQNNYLKQILKYQYPYILSLYYLTIFGYYAITILFELFNKIWESGQRKSPIEVNGTFAFLYLQNKLLNFASEASCYSVIYIHLFVHIV